MTKQETIAAGTLSSALVAALAEIGGATKDKINPHFGKKYADLSSVVDAIKPVLARHGLAFTQSTEPTEGGVTVETILWFDGAPRDDGWGSAARTSLGKLFVPANKNDAQGFGSALTYARRYSLMTAFGVPAEDDDGNAAVASARPSTGETPPQKPVKLEGPYSSRTALQGAIKTFATTLNAMDDLGEFSAWMETPDVVELEKQAMRYLPEWWDEGMADKPEFEPMVSRIERKKRELEELDSCVNVLRAG